MSTRIIVKEARLEINNEATYENMIVLFENDEQKDIILNNLIKDFIRKE